MVDHEGCVVHHLYHRPGAPRYASALSDVVIQQQTAAVTVADDDLGTCSPCDPRAKVTSDRELGNVLVGALLRQPDADNSATLNDVPVS